MTRNTPIPVLGFAAFSGTGKTTLLTQVIPHLVATGLRIGLIKHSHHHFQIDKPGKDSFRLREAGAEQVLLASSKRTALIVEKRDNKEPQLTDQLSMLADSELELILVEGFKHAPIPKIEIHRKALGHPLLYLDDKHIIALVTDPETIITVDIPQFDINQPVQVAQFILNDFLQHG